MLKFEQLLVAGLTLGAVYGISALALTLVARVSTVINFAQGEFVSVSFIGMAVLGRDHGFPRPVAFAVVTVGVVAIAYLFSRLAIVPAWRRGSSVADLLLVTLALALVGQGVTYWLFGRDLYRADALIVGTPLTVFGARVPLQNLILLVATLCVGIILAAFFRWTMLGKAMSACAENKEGAGAVGIDTGLLVTVAMCMSAVLGAVTGLLLSSITIFSYLTGFRIAMVGLAAAAIVGMRSPLRALVAGLGLGTLEALVAGYISSASQTVIVFMVLIGTVLMFPGLLKEA